MGPRPMRHRQRLEETLGAQRATLGSGTDGAGRDKLRSVLADGRPPEAAAQEGQGAADPRVTAELSRVGPRKDLGPDLFRHVEPPGRGIHRSSHALQGPLHKALNVKVGGSGRQGCTLSSPPHREHGTDPGVRGVDL